MSSDDVRKVLVVEDSRGDFILLQEILSRAAPGFELTWEIRLDKALARAGTTAFDVILLDLTLPDSHGLATLERVQAEARHVPVVVMTGLGDEEVAISAIQQGAQDYLVKGSVDGRSIAKSIRFAIDRKKTEERLRHSEAAYSAAKASVDTINAMATGVVLVGMDGNVISANPAFEDLTGYSNVEIAGQSGKELVRLTVTPADRSAALEALAGLQNGRPVGFLSVTLNTKNGRAIPVVVTLAHVRDSANRPSAMVLTVSDISDLKQAEERLRKSQATLAEAQRVAHIGNWDWNIASDRVEWSEETRRIFGLMPRSSGGARAAMLHTVHREDRHLVEEATARALAGQAVFSVEHRVALSDGSERVVHQQGEVFRDDKGTPVRMLGTVQDITELRRTMRQNQVAAALLALFAGKADRKEYLDAVARVIQEWSGCRCIGIRVLNEKGEIPYESHLGFSDEFVASESILTVGRDQCACTRVVSGLPDPQDKRCLSPAGSFRCENTFEFVRKLSEHERERFRGVCIKAGFASVSVVPIRRDEKVVGAIHFADEKDRMVSPEMVGFAESTLSPIIGEALHRFDVERDLRTAGTYNRSLIEAGLDPLVMIDKEGRITDVNAATETVTGYSREELIGTDFSDYFTDPALARAGYRQVFQDGAVRDYALDIRHRNGGVTPVLYNASVYRDESGRIAGVLAAARDITERRKAQAVLEVYQQELRSLSSMLTLAEERARRHLAVALHDTVGQTLALAKIKLGSLGQQLTRAEPQKALVEIREMFEDAVRQTRTLSFELSPPILYELGLGAALEWLGEDFAGRHGLEVRFRESGQAAAIAESTSVLFFQSARELLANVAKHAEAKTVHMSLKTEGGQVSLKITDDGKGMQADAATDAFRGRKSLGLFSIRERMRHIGGTFGIQSRTGRGTTAILSAPTAESARAAAGPEAGAISTNQQEQAR